MFKYLVFFIFFKGNSNFELGTAICYVNVENYFLTIIKHIAVPSSKLEFPLEINFILNLTVLRSCFILIKFVCLFVNGKNVSQNFINWLYVKILFAG